MKNEIDIQIKVPNQTRYLSLIGNIGENMARDICQPSVNRDFFAHNLNVVLTEAMANAIRHASSADQDTEVQISIHITKDELSIKVYDPISMPIS